MTHQTLDPLPTAMEVVNPYTRHVNCSCPACCPQKPYFSSDPLYSDGKITYPLSASVPLAPSPNSYTVTTTPAEPMVTMTYKHLKEKDDEIKRLADYIVTLESDIHTLYIDGEKSEKMVLELQNSMSKLEHSDKDFINLSNVIVELKKRIWELEKSLSLVNGSCGLNDKCQTCNCGEKING